MVSGDGEADATMPASSLAALPETHIARRRAIGRSRPRLLSCPLIHSLYCDYRDHCRINRMNRRRRYLNQVHSPVLTNPSTLTFAGFKPDHLVVVEQDPDKQGFQMHITGTGGRYGHKTQRPPCDARFRLRGYRCFRGKGR